MSMVGNTTYTDYYAVKYFKSKLAVEVPFCCILSVVRELLRSLPPSRITPELEFQLE